MFLKKYKSVLIIILIFIIFTIQIVSASTLPLMDTIITIDAGHQ